MKIILNLFAITSIFLFIFLSNQTVSKYNYSYKNENKIITTYNTRRKESCLQKNRDIRVKRWLYNFENTHIIDFPQTTVKREVIFVEGDKLFTLPHTKKRIIIPYDEQKYIINLPYDENIEKDYIQYFSK